MRRTIVLWSVMMTVAGLGLAQENTAPPAKTQSGYEVSGTLLNAVSGDPLSKAKVWIVPVPNNDLNPDDTPQRGPGRVRAGTFGGGGGFGPGGGERAFAGRGQRGLQQQSEPEPTTETFTDAAGHFALEGVMPGAYTMFAERKGFPRQALDHHGNFNTPVIVGDGKETQNIVFRAMPDSVISGRITDDFNDPVPNARVFLFYLSADSGEESVRRRNTSSTDPGGNYRFTHLPPGTYYIVVSAQPWYAMYGMMMGMQTNPDGTTGPQEGDANLDVAFGVTYFSNAANETDATPIPLQPGEHFQADMIMNTTPAVHIPIAGVDPKSPRTFPQISTTAFGQEIFVQPQMRMMRPPSGDGQPPSMALALAPGQYQADIREFNGGPGGSGGGPTQLRRQTLDAAPGAVIDVNRGEEPAKVTGTVTFEGTADKPRGNVIFRKTDGSDGGNTGRSNPDGEFETQLYPGKYNITAGFPHFVIKSVTGTGAKLTGRTLEVTGNGPIKLTIVMSQNDARIEGKVKTADGGKPAAGAFVILVPEDVANNEPLIRRSQSGTDGSFQFTQVIPGKYTLVAVQNGWNLEWAKPEAMKPFIAKGEPVEVAAKARMKVEVKVQ